MPAIDDEWWAKKIELQGLTHSFREDGFEVGMIQAPVGKVLLPDGRVVDHCNCFTPAGCETLSCGEVNIMGQRFQVLLRHLGAHP